MHRKSISLVVGLLLVVSPVIASAQTVSTSNSSLIAVLEQLVAVLTQELQALIAAQSQPTTHSTSDNFSASPTSGAAPLEVTFTYNPSIEGGDLINYGDGQTSTLPTGCSSGDTAGQSCGITHLYTSPRTYTVTVNQPSVGEVDGLAITVTGSNSNSPLSANCNGSPYNAGMPGMNWSVSPSGGSGSYTYQWTLSNDYNFINDTLGGLQTNAVMATYASTGLKNASVVVSDGNTSVTASCSATIGAPSGQPPATNFTASPSSGAAPLSVTFTTTGGQFQSAAMNFGDGASEQMATLFGNSTSNSAGYCGAGPDFFCSLPHIYTSPGTYTAALENSSGVVLATQTVTITSSTSGVQPTAAFTLGSLIVAPNTPFTISGTATGVQSVRIAIGANGESYFQSDALPVTNGQWQTEEAMGLSAGRYPISIQGYTDTAGTQPAGSGIGGLLTGSTLIVN